MNLTVDREDVQAFFATLPADPERDRRADALRAAAKIFTDALGRKRELSARIEQIAHELVDATGKDRESLIAERGAVAACSSVQNASGVSPFASPRETSRS